MRILVVGSCGKSKLKTQNMLKLTYVIDINQVLYHDGDNGLSPS